MQQRQQHQPAASIRRRNSQLPIRLNRMIMEESLVTLSIVTNGKTNAIAAQSDSITSSHPFNPPSKRPRNSGAVSRFKGVVPQQNGHWGAQIYANHQRIWLGTFKTERDAAMAYDSAAIRLRNADSRRNFPWSSLTIQERTFQSHYSTEAMISMIRDGSYPSGFANFLTSRSRIVDKDATNGSMAVRQLFRKELTPSDVGKLNRLVIPKQYAVKFFPQVSDRKDSNDVQLVFHDRSMKLWEFRYCYWKSSQSFVFTRGWNRFVKENQLKAGDSVCFYLCELRQNAQGTRCFCMIDACKGGNGVAVGGVSDRLGDLKVDLQLRLSHNIVDEEGNETEAPSGGVMEFNGGGGQNLASCDTKTIPFKLFGVTVS